MARPLTSFEKDRARAWMRERRGEMSQDALARDIRQTTDWSITRDRYSKYESGGTDFGRGVLDKFIAYWKDKGQSGPDFTPPVPDKPVDPVAAAIDRQTEAIKKQTDMLKAVLTAIATPRMTDDDRRWVLEQVAASKG